VKPTCRTIEPGGGFLRRDNGQHVYVRETHHGLRCEIGECEWFLLFPTRVGVDRIEEIRHKHIGTAHFTELVQGRCQITEENLQLEEA
jgi:hypothetical protein